MTKLLTSFLALTLIFISSGCATIFGGAMTSHLKVESSQPIAIKVVGSDGQVVNKTTPFSMDLDRSSNYTVKIKSEKYESEDVYVGRKVRAIAFLNLFCLLCWAIDFMTGNVWDHSQHYVYIDLAELDRKKASNDEVINANIYISVEGKDTNQEPATVKMHRELKFFRVG